MTAVDQDRTSTAPPRRTVRRAFGQRRVLPAVLTAAVLTAAAVIVMAEVVGALVHRPPGLLPVAWLARLGRETHWEDVLVLGVGAALAAVGLLLLVLALRPGRLRVIVLRSENLDAVVGITSRGLRHYAERAARNVDGIARARVKVHRNCVRVRADSPLREDRDLSDDVRRAVAERMEALALLRWPRLHVTVRHRED